MRDKERAEMSAYNNCVVDPQAMLAKALEEKSLQDFKMALDMDADPTRIDETTNISLFEKALQTYGCSEFVAECIKRGCKCDYINRRLNKCPINFAADSRDPKIIMQLLRLKDIAIDAKYAHLTSLNSLAKNITPENADESFECIRLLIKYGANPNIPDQKEMTPILYIINSRKLDNDKKKEIIKFILDNSDVDLDTFRDGEARERLRSRFPDIELPAETITEVGFETLMALLRNEHEEKFLKLFNEYQLNISDKDNQQNMSQEQNGKLLMEAVKKGLNNAVEMILRTGINVNMVENGNTAIELACINGNFKALEMLLKHNELRLRRYENLLITVIKNLDEPVYGTNFNYDKCLELLLSSPKININEIDQSGSSALHYGVKYKNEKVIKKLLEKGAYIGTKSMFNDLPISEMNPEVLEEYLDSCITTNGFKPGDDNFEIIINYTNFIPHQDESKSKTINPCIINEEMLPIKYMADSKEFKHLLKHPVITSFLFLKWHNLSVIFYLNFLFYVVFCASLVTYIMLHFNNAADESVLVTFKTLAFLGLIYMILREGIQFLISPIMFLRTVVNYLEIILIILTIITLCDPNYEKETQRVIAVFTILLASIELCLLVGSLPVLSISTHMLMLRAVSRSFIRSFSLYSIFVITFSLCFYILFGKVDNKPNENTNPNDNDDDDEGEFNKFVNPFTAIIKTIVMLTGEFDAGDIGLNSFVSYFIFLLFVMFMSIVLFNLLNGLAVSDTQVIKAQAELNGCICRTNLLESYEKVLAEKRGKTASFLNYQPLRLICKRIINIFPNCICGNQIAILPNASNKILIPVATNPKEFTLTSINKTNGNLSLLTNDDTDGEKQLLKAPIKFLPCCCICFNRACSEMDVRTVKTALAIIDKRQKERNKNSNIENRLRNIEDKLDAMFNVLKRSFVNEPNL